MRDGENHLKKPVNQASLHLSIVCDVLVITYLSVGSCGVVHHALLLPYIFGNHVPLTIPVTAMGDAAESRKVSVSIASHLPRSFQLLFLATQDTSAMDDRQRQCPSIAGPLWPNSGMYVKRMFDCTGYWEDMRRYIAYLDIILCSIFLLFSSSIRLALRFLVNNSLCPRSCWRGWKPMRTNH